jgi:hypothetical protein
MAGLRRAAVRAECPPEPYHQPELSILFHEIFVREILRNCHGKLFPRLIDKANGPVAHSHRHVPGQVRIAFNQPSKSPPMKEWMGIVQFDFHRRWSLTALKAFFAACAPLAVQSPAQRIVP